jgi:HlyD family secretion protein
MKKILLHRYLYITGALVMGLFVILMIIGVGKSNQTDLITATVESGSVRQLVSVSGIAEAKRTAELAFPTGGIVREVSVETGSIVAPGEVLVTLDTQSLLADRQDALGALTRAQADLAELRAGPTATARTTTAETVITKEIALAETKETEQQKITNAYRALLSDDLIAYTNDIDQDAPAPTISGTYTCNEEGTYLLSVFSSQADSGYSFYLSGLETSTYPVGTEQPGPLGACGLQILFAGDGRYARSEWLIDIPNTRSSSYTTNYNAYILALSQANNAITLAEQALTLATSEAVDQNAPSRPEAITRAEASVTQAAARLSRIDTAIAERTITAPFAGVVTDIDILPGETVTTLPVVTLLATSEFIVKARIPEIDISKLSLGQSVEMLFDARIEELVTGEITFISPQATVIDGVAYYEATILFTAIPSWMREGLNADIDIIVSQATDGLRVPKRFVTKTISGGYEVLLKQNDTIATTTVEVTFEGNDGFVVITGLTEGDTLVAP